MRAFIRFLLVFSVCRALLAQDAPPAPPVLPQDLTLTSKVVLHKISVVRWEKDRVIIKHLGGSDPILYKYIAEPQRATMLALRDAQMGKAPPPMPTPDSSAPPAPATGKFAGQCYLTLVGSGITYKMSGVTILIEPPEAVDRFKDNNSTINLPKPLLQITTDGGGNFNFELPDKQGFYLVAQSYRLVGGQRTYYHWRMASTDLKDPGHIILNSDNSTGESKKLLFDHEEK